MIRIDFEETAFNLEEGRLCLDFSNTANWHASEHPEESINSYADLVAWALDKRLLDESEARQLLDEASHQPQMASRVLERAIELREAIYHIFSAEAHSLPIREEDLNTLNAELSPAMAHSKVILGDGGFTWVWSGNPTGLDRILGPIARSAADLLTSSDLDRIGECADDRGCGWVFLDTSRNHSRRWCSMESCGNRAKAQRHYTRRKETT